MTAHATLGASSAKRWMTCPGSVRMSEGLPDPESAHAREGSAAHALGEICLLRGDAAFEYLGEPHPVEEFEDVPVSADMVAAVDVYVRHVREQLGKRKLKREMVERRVSLAALGDWAAEMFGTADFVWYDGRTKTLYVNDYKHGQGVAVEVEDNPQLKYYAVGALLELQLVGKAERAVVTIIQPRKPHDDGPIRSVEYRADDLMAWAEGELREAVLATREPDAPLRPSEEACRFCRARGVCPALADQAMASAMLDFDHNRQMAPQVPMERLSAEQIATILDNEKRIRAWLDGVAGLATECLKHGEDLTGGRFKLVAGRSQRSWKNEDVAATKLYALGFEDDDLYTRKMLTPAQAEKLVGKAHQGDLAQLIDKQDGKPTLAPAQDKRPALSYGPEADFQEDS